MAGAHGIEGRFPYLDVDLVQEYLWLNTTLKATRQGAPARSKCPNLSPNPNPNRRLQQPTRPPAAPEPTRLLGAALSGPGGGASPLSCRRKAAAALRVIGLTLVSLRLATQSRPGPGQAAAPRLPGARRLPGGKEEARLLGRELAGVEPQPHPAGESAGEARRRGEPAREASGARRGSCGRAGRDANARGPSEHRGCTGTHALM